MIPVVRAASTIEGLDFVLDGGFPVDRVYLIEGDPGTGKTTLALQFLLEGVRRGEGALYVTLSETEQELHAVAASHGWSLDGVTIHELGSDEGLRPDAQYTAFHPAEVELGDTMSTVFQTFERVGPRRVVFDSLSEMRLLARDPLRYRRQVLALKQFFVGRHATVLLLDDRTAEGGDSQLQSLANGVVRLEQLSPEYGRSRRRLRVLKMRGVAFREGYHDFTIETGGLQVYARLVASEHHRSFLREGLSSGLPGLDRLLGGGLTAGTTTLFLGPAGSGKTMVAMHFAVQATREEGHAAAFLFDEGLGTLFAGLAGIGLDAEAPLEAGRLTVHQLDPAEVSPGAFAYMVRAAVEQRNARVVIIDSLTGYLNAMPEEKFLALHLHELFTYLRQRGVVTIVIVGQRGLFGAMETAVDISYLADTVLLTRFFEVDGVVRKAISIVKKRAGAHEATIRELHISGDGLRVGEPLHGFRGILTGVPEYDGTLLRRDDGEPAT
jgi:circadian clock protein KaiC